MRRSKRQQLLGQLRAFLESRNSWRDVLEEKKYLQIRRHMRSDTIDELEKGEKPYRLSRDKKEVLLDELDHLEDKWKLI